jgi:hypothetical protein
MASPNFEKDFLSYLLPTLSHLMSVTVEELVPFSNYETDLKKLSITNPQLYDQIIAIYTSAVKEILIPIVETEYRNKNPISYYSVQQFIDYNARVLKLLQNQLNPQQIGTLNLTLFHSTIERINKQQKIGKEAREVALKLVNILIDYTESIVTIIQHRKSHLEEALKEIDRQEFLRSLYGASLGFLCLLTTFEIKRLKDEERFLPLAESALVYAEELESYTESLDILTNPEELELLRKAEAENMG